MTRRQEQQQYTWELEGEVQRSEQDGEENPPATSVNEEAQGTSGYLVCFRSGSLALGETPVRGGEQTESGDEGGEDQDEDDVGAEGANHVDEAEESHPQQEEACKTRIVSIHPIHCGVSSSEGKPYQRSHRMLQGHRQRHHLQ